ncbi:glycosyltransferase family 39 protein [Candidatus Peregrinibacteria bacterium]|nr:glycosyltransferase family 39 protein [Candidatus Peregrinibacteria bacterium]
MQHIRRFLPEIGLGALLLFFACRELGTFPAPWADEGLFVTVAKMVASGKGYALPLLHATWYEPYFLNVGPLFILPSALSMAVFGISSTAARLPMVFFLIAATALFSLFVKRIDGRHSARLATALLITLSAYINTGKPVLGEIPAFVCLLAGLLFLLRPSSWKRNVGSGIFFGFALMTKITFGIILPSLGIAGLFALWRRQWKEVRSLLIVGLLAIAVELPWRMLEMQHALGGGLMSELRNFLIGNGETASLHFLSLNPGLLLTLPPLAFGVFFVLGTVGWWHLRKRIPATVSVTSAAFVLFFAAYYLNGPGWYRLLLPGHLLLLAFVPDGARRLFGKRMGAIVLVVIIAAQAYWQWDHRGSSQSLESGRAAQVLMRTYVNQDLLIAQTEVFSQLPMNPHWLFLIPNLSFSMPAAFHTVSGMLCSVPILLKVSPEDQRKYRPEQLSTVAGRYVLVRGYPCPYTLP